MNKKTIRLLCLTAAGIMMSACHHPTIYNSSAAYRQLETEIVKNDLDGYVTLKAFGNGLNETDAIEQAMRNAVNEVMFKGIANGDGTKNVPAIFRNPNIRLDNQNYFEDFFLRDYPRYVQVLQKYRDMEGYGSGERINMGVLLKVDVNGLRRHFRSDGLLK